MTDKKPASKKSPFWARVEELLGRARRKRRGVNLSRLSVLTQADQTVVVADKVLGTGRLAHPLTVAAPAFSASALSAIARDGGKALPLEKMREQNPAGKGLIILI